MTKHLTPEYRNQLQLTHSQDPGWGYGHDKEHYPTVKRQFIEVRDCYSFIDYGCGKGSLTEKINKEGYQCIGYDPGVSQYHAMPSAPADCLLCLDVLEHVEPSCLGSVLQHIRSLYTKYSWFIIDLKPAVKKLHNGSNAHLIVEDRHWWEAQLLSNGITPQKTFMANEQRWSVVCE